MTILGKLRSSIPAKLLLCFLALVAVSVIAFALTLSSLLSSQNSQERLAEFTVPLLQESQSLSRAVSKYIISIERLPLRTLPETGASELAASEQAIESAISVIEGKLPGSDSIQRIRELLTLMQTGSGELRTLIVDKRPGLNEAIKSKRQEITGALGNIRGAIKRLEVKLILSGAGDEDRLTAINRLTNSLAGIRIAVDRYNPVFPVLEIRALQNQYKIAVRSLVSNNLAVEDQQIKAAISEHVDVLLANIGSQASFFDHAIQLASLREQVDRTIQDNRTLENQILDEIADLVDAASETTTNDLREINEASTSNIRTLGIELAATIIIAIAIIVFYVNPNIISRLNILADKTKRIAEGDYHARISIEGNDEISGMSKALETFRNGMMDKERLLQSLAASNEELERFAYVCSHDLQEPVRMIQAFSEKLDQRISGRIEDDETAQLYLSYVTDAAVRSQNLIRDIMAYSRLDKETEAFNNVDLNQIVEEAIISLKGQEVDLMPNVKFNGLPTIQGNKTQMYQLFHNLISNGLKYNKHGDEALVEIRAQPKQDMWEITVKDNGIGIEPRHQQKIFEVFRRLHRKEEYPGTGIGLSICKKIVENHRGSISVTSEIGQGSEFTFTLLKEAA